MKMVISIAIMLLVASPSKAEECGYAADGRECPEELCCSIWGYCGYTDRHCSSPYCQSQCPPSLHVISRELFHQMLPNRTFYTHDAFVAAARDFPGFGTTGTMEVRKRELAAFFAQTSHQTTGYCFVSEANGGEYSEPSLQWPSYPGRQYYGRGPFQLTYNYNYGPAGKAIGENLLLRPELVADDPTISFKTAIWFWMTPRDNMPSSHDIITGAWAPTPADVAANRLPGYGVVTNIINGRVECGHADDNRVQNRIGLYKRFCEILGVSPGDNLDCKDQMPFEFSLTNGYLKYPDHGILKMA